MELAYATPVAMGIALGAPGRRVVALEGDGSLFAAAPVLGTIARHPPANLTVIVLANGIWGTGDGSVPTTLTEPSQWTALAIACGWPADRALLTKDLAAFEAALEKSAREPGPWFICAVTGRSSVDMSGNRARPGIDTVEAADRLRRDLSS
jgi:thiamine pyrophosphate-dependent acetolactate synthase large subunit-like protein